MKAVKAKEHLGTIKRIFDLSISVLMLLLIFPVMMVFAILVKLDSKGPVFYKQLRVGINNRIRSRRFRSSRRIARRLQALANESRRQELERRSTNFYGKPFPVLKFRTMVVDSEKDGRPVWCQTDDPRITRLGRFMRKTHMDELPQLINIIRGDMSLVGPRPERPEFVVTLIEQIPEYKNRLALKPGLTGLAQIRHRADLVLDDVKKKIRYDFLYIKKASLSTDLLIILGTVPLVLGFSMYAFKRLKKARRFFANLQKREIAINGK
jgi:lipopolysaccharide/colanic/teichoic acid biosynthesis glycosyltransferase